MRKKHLLVIGAALALMASIVLVGGNRSASASPAVSVQTASVYNYNSPCYGVGSWNTLAEKDLSVGSTDRITAFRAGRQTRCDRLVFELTGGRPVGYLARYGAYKGEDGKYILAAGRQQFSLTITAWPRGVWTPTTTDDFYLKVHSVLYPRTNPKGLWNVRQVKSAGAHEGYSTYVVGLSKKTPFRLFTLRLANGHRAVVVEFKR